MIDTPGYVVIVILGIILLIAISYYWVRFLFSIKRQLWNQKKSLYLLSKIAEKSGAISSEEAKQVMVDSSRNDSNLD